VSRFVFKLPDLGEGTVEAEIVAWHVEAGDTVAEEDVIVEVMTDKASVEVPAPVSGRVLSTTGAPGDMVPVGAELIVFETDVGVAGEAAPAAVVAEAPRTAAVEAPRVAAAEAPKPAAAEAPKAAAVPSARASAANGHAPGDRQARGHSPRAW
jgi:2-oxoisovalerate dehydrogenase E2 component (dihydrolipoyl transacylase)